MRGQTLGTYAELLYSMPAAGAPVANTLTRTLLSGSTSTAPAYKLPAGFFPADGGVHQAIKVIARGFYGTTGTPTLLVAAALDTTAGTYGTTLAATGAYTTESGAGAGTVGFELEFDCVCNAVGTSGSLATAGIYSHGAAANAATVAGSSLMVGSSTAIAINTTVDNYLEIWGTWGTSSASNSVQLTQLLVFGLN